MNRRGFLTAVLALGAAPAIVRARSLMPVRVLEDDYVAIVHPEFEKLLRGELGRLDGVRFIGPTAFDYGNQHGLGIVLPDGRSHAVRCYGREIHPRTLEDMQRRLLTWARQTPRSPRGILLA